LAKIVVVLVLGFVGFLEDEHSFSTLASAKDKLCNKLGLTLDMIVQMFAQDFYTQGNFFIRKHSQHGRIAKCKSMLPLERFSFFLAMCFYFYNLNKFSEDTYLSMSFIDIWVWCVRL
jgi:hypothetical protein